MKWTIFAAVLLCITFNNVKTIDSNEYQIKSNEALEFLYRSRRSFLHPGKTKCEEQKREARKGYEEKCTILGKRFCPKLTSWNDFYQWEIGNGYESGRNPLPTPPPTLPPVHTMRTYRTPFHTRPTLPTYRTPLHKPVSQRPIYRAENTD